MTTNNNYCIEQDDELYQMAVEREQQSWTKKFNMEQKETGKFQKEEPGVFTRSRQKIFSDLNPSFIRYNNYIIGQESDDRYYWVDFLSNKIGKFEHGLSVGSGMGDAEDLFLEKGIVKKWSTIDLVDTSNYVDGKKLVNHMVGDLNFINLNNKKFDLILCRAILHHLINLEDVLFQLNKALNPNGVIIIRECIAESKVQWDDYKLNYINNKLQKQFGDKLKKVKLTKPIVNHKKPFECIRSGDIYNIINIYFGENKLFEYTWNGISFTVISQLRKEHHQRIKDNNIIREIVDYSIKLDDECHDKKINPCSIFGVYRKSNIPNQIPAIKWGEQEKKFKLELRNLQPFRKRIKSYSFYKFLRKLKYRFAP